jgi:hypothetical protein
MWIALWLVNFVKLYFYWAGTVKLLKFTGAVAYDFSKAGNIFALPIIICDRWFN